jgi:hypothetical protein
LIAAGAVGATLTLVLLAVRVVRARRARRRNGPATEKTSAGSGGFYTAAFMSLGLSVDTSWRFFEHVIGIENVVERVGMFAIIEVLLVSCGWALRVQARKPNSDGQGPYQVVAWVLAGGAAFMAVAVTDNFWVGLFRVGLGPVAGLVALHLALGLDLRHRNPGGSTGTAARITNELLQRGLSVLGLGDDDRDAARRRSDRHARRLAWMVVDGVPTKGRARRKFDRHVRLSNIAHDQDARHRLLAELAVIQHIDQLAGLSQPAPWGSGPRTLDLGPSDPAEVQSPDPGPSDPAEVRTPDPGPRTLGPSDPRTPDPAEVQSPDPGPSDPAEVRTPDLGPSDVGDEGGPRTVQFPALTEPTDDDEVFAAAVAKGVQVFHELTSAGERVNQKKFRDAFRASGASIRNSDVPALWAAVRDRATTSV